jgi:hypothetical protein
MSFVFAGCSPGPGAGFLAPSLTLAVKFDVLCNVEAVAVSWRSIGDQSLAF